MGKAFHRAVRAEGAARKLILRNVYSPGDIVVLTAAVRDLHACHHGAFQTDVRTSCAELWEHNPHLTPLSEDDPEVETIECSCPLINQSGQGPYHYVHAYIDFLNDRLGLDIRPTAFKGDIHLSAREKAWYSQVHELTREDTPFWIVAAGGKYDVTIKWWATERYQAVIDHFRDRIQFVQVGGPGHHHPCLDGVIDLRGRTSLRELVRLVYHAQGVLCPVTALMHLTAAVETKNRHLATRPCVVVAGAREPAHWEAYPGHQFIHTNGAVACGGPGGCWRDRVRPLGDGDLRDRPDHRCVDVVTGLPRCMDLITPEDVIRRIEAYFEGGALRHLTARQAKAARRGVEATRSNPFDNGTLTLAGARLACERFIRTIPPCPDRFAGRGVILCAGGVRYFTNAWVCINRLRELGCRLRIQLWHLGPAELDAGMAALLEPLGVECVDALKVRRTQPVRMLGGWPLKPYAILHSPFEEVLLLDADNVPVVDPTFLFELRQFRATGAVFWPDYARRDKAAPAWRSCGVRRPAEPEFESGQVLLDKRRCWAALRLTLWFNENADFYYRYLHGDKDTFQLAFRRLKTPYALVPHPIQRLPGTMCQHDFDGRRIFQHRNTDKWDLFLRNWKVRGFRDEARCRRLIEDLRKLWDGRVSAFARPSVPALRSSSPRLVACMISCPERDKVREQTLRNLARTDWETEPLVVRLNGSVDTLDAKARQTRTAILALKRGLDEDADYVLFLEDDLDFNRHLLENLERWQPVRDGGLTLGGLYNPGLRESACDVANHAIIVEPRHVFGSQAFLISRSTVEYLVRCWHRVAGMQDIRMSRLAGRLKRPIYYHVPSLVQHCGRSSVWGGPFHQARDFDPHWKA